MKRQIKIYYEKIKGILNNASHELNDNDYMELCQEVENTSYLERNKLEEQIKNEEDKGLRE